MKNEWVMMWLEAVGVVTKIFWAQEGGKGWGGDEDILGPRRRERLGW